MLFQDLDVVSVGIFDEDVLGRNGGLASPVPPTVRLDGLHHGFQIAYVERQVSELVAQLVFALPVVDGQLDLVRAGGVLQEDQRGLVPDLRAPDFPEPDQAALLDECGDLLFAAVNLVRFAGMDPELALQQTNDKFISRFQRVEAQCAATGRGVADMDLETLEKFWERAKQEEGG